MGDEAGAIGAAPGGDSEHDEGLLKYVEVPACRLVLDLGGATERVDVHGGTRRGSDEVEQPGIATEIANERLGLDFLAQVYVRVAPQQLRSSLRVVLRPRRRQCAVRQGAVEFEARPKLSRE